MTIRKSELRNHIELMVKRRRDAEIGCLCRGGNTDHELYRAEIDALLALADRFRLGKIDASISDDDFDKMGA